MTEQEILKFWQDNKIFEKSLEKPAGEEPKADFVFYDGPPFATGTPHYGHILASVIKDVIPRYQTMKGKRVPRQWGWDCHGLPIENIAEKELGIKQKKEIEGMGIAKFNEFCRSKVLSYTDEWKKVIGRLGRWADMENPYKTMDLSYMENVWNVFKQLWDKRLIYEGYRSMHICTRCETTLSQQEVAEGYKDIKDLSAIVKFELIDSPSASSGQARIFVLAWTTTPWTLIGNVALAVNDKIVYVKIQKSRLKNQNDNSKLKNNEYYILAKDRLNEVLKDEFYEVIEEFKGKDLIKKKYKPLFDYYVSAEALAKEDGLKNRENGWKIYAADFVITNEGTGVVHIAPAFGEDDLNLGKKENLPFIQHVGMDGKIKPEAVDFAGMSVKPQDDHQKTDVEIIKYLAKNNLLFSKEKYEHSYPHCWRCDTPLINYATSSWFVNVIKLKERALELAKGISWVPMYLKEGRFGKWLEGARDWSISRQRFWASAIPIWKCDKCAETKVIGSIDELRANIKKSGNKYFVMRHGEAESNSRNIVSSEIEFAKNHPLTAKGREQVMATAKMFREKNHGKIDLIFASDFARVKETVEIMTEQMNLDKSQIIYEPRLREINTGIFNGRNPQEYHDYFSSLEEKFYKNSPGGENLNELKKRVGEFIYEIDSKYQNKKILIVSHEYPIWMLFSAVIGLDEKQATIIRKSKDDFVKTAELRELDFIPLPHGENFVLDIHRPYIDAVEFNCACGGIMKRIPDVLDTWFDSGSMPYTCKEFPAEFIGEGVDQTRAWFYYLHLIATALKDSIAYKNVIVNGIVLAEDGKKMAKRLKNYPDPMEVMEKYGADALRYYLLTSPVVQAENLNFSEKGVDEARKKVVLRLKNVLAFYKLYADSYGLKLIDTDEKIGINQQDRHKSASILDRWVLIRLNQLIDEVSKFLDRYELDKAARPIEDFVEDLSNWYVRRSRFRFSERGTTRNEREMTQEELGEDKLNAAATLRYVLIELSKIIAPFMPFLAEEIYQGINREAGGMKQESVHLNSWPQIIKLTEEDKKILEEMKKTREVVSVALEERAKAGIKVRQPLQTFSASAVISGTSTIASDEFLSLIKDEINVKKIKIGQKENKLDTNIAPELKNEGIVRELARNIQDLRKKEGLAPQNKVGLIIETDAAGEKLLKEFESEIKKSVNADEIEFVKNEGEEINIDELKFKIKIKK